jgi:phosphate uptake regulator
MRRKVIQLAGKTFVVSLPSSWAKEWHIRKGEELEVVPNGPRLTISTASEREQRKSNLDISHANERVIRWLLSSLHKKGYDEIELVYKGPEQAALIHELIKDLFIGFAIVHQTDTRCVIRCVSKEVQENFDAMLRRAFLVTLNLAESAHELLSKGKTNNLHSLLALEKTNNQLTNFCERILNKHGYPEPAKTTFAYAILWNLEKIADEYKYLCKSFATRRVRFSPATLSAFAEVNRFVRTYYELFYSYNSENLNALAEDQKRLEQKLRSLLTSPDDALLASYLLHVVTKAADFSASTVALHHN